MLPTSRTTAENDIQTPTPARRYGPAVIGLVAVALIALLIPEPGFRLDKGANVAFHLLVETAGIVVCALVLRVSQSPVGFEPKPDASLAGGAFAGAAILNFIHMLTAGGMPDFITPSGGGKAISFYFGSRLLVALALLAIAVVPLERMWTRAWTRTVLVASIAFSAALGTTGLFMPEVLPLYFVPGSGLTAAKVYTDYVLSGLNFAACGVLMRRACAASSDKDAGLALAACTLGLSSLLFTRYSINSDIYNIVGHAYQALAFWFVYKAIYLESVAAPYRALRASEARLSGLVSSAMDAIVSVDARQRIVLFNAAAEAMFGRTFAQVRGSPLSVLLPERFRAAHGVLVDSYGRSGEASRRMGALGVICGARADGSEFPIEASISRTGSGDDAVLTVILRDISVRVRAEAEAAALGRRLSEQSAMLEKRVQERTAQLEAINKELESFSYSVSHDLRAPIRHILGFAQIVLESARTLPEDLAGHLRRIEAAARKMNQLIDDLLAFSRTGQQDLVRAPVSLAALVAEVRARLAAEGASPRIQWEIGMLPEVEADSALLGIVLYNLIGNAVKYSSKRDDPVIRVDGVTLASGETEVVVSDNGAGFDMAYADKLFGVFSRLHSDKEFSGTGVGLATVRRIVERHGGQVRARGETGRGAEFRFTLPGPAQA